MKNINIETPQLGRQRWMIVDDNQHVLSMMRSVLARFTDADLQCFCSPHAALATFTAAPEAFDFIITDLEMPGMSGIELGSRLKKISPATKVLLSTGSGILTENEAVQRGFCGLLSKPFPFGSLRRVLERAGLVEMPVKNNFETSAALTLAKGCLA
jgi:DNA-binding NtrC family response regulator